MTGGGQPLGGVLLIPEVLPDLVDDEVELVEATLREASCAADLAASRSLDDLGGVHPLMVFLV